MEALIEGNQIWQKEIGDGESSKQCEPRPQKQATKVKENLSTPQLTNLEPSCHVTPQKPYNFPFERDTKVPQSNRLNQFHQCDHFNSRDFNRSKYSIQAPQYPNRKSTNYSQDPQVWGLTGHPYPHSMPRGQNSLVSPVFLQSQQQQANNISKEECIISPQDPNRRSTYYSPHPQPPPGQSYQYSMPILQSSMPRLSHTDYSQSQNKQNKEKDEGDRISTQNINTRCTYYTEIPQSHPGQSYQSSMTIGKTSMVHPVSFQSNKNQNNTPNDDDRISPQDPNRKYTYYDKGQRSITPNLQGTRKLSKTSLYKSSTQAHPTHPKPQEAPHLLHELPTELQNFVEKIYDVRSDGHCGFRAAAFCLDGQEQGYMEIREKLYKEVQNHREFYQKEGTFIDIEYSLLSILATSSGPVGRRHWMSMPSMGEAMANAFETPVFFFSKEISQTCFPHFCAPNSNNPIFIAYIKSKDHFVALKMKSPHIFPAPRPLKNWKMAASPQARAWEEVYSNCFV